MKVIVGIEDRQYGEAIINFIATQKWASATQFELIHVIDTMPSGEFVGELCCPEAMSLSEAEKKDATEMLMEFDLKLVKAVPDASTDQRLVYGPPKQVLLDEVEKAKADLLIVGSHGRTGFGRFLLGSVSMALLSHAPCSVLIVKLPAGTEQKPAKSDKSLASTKAN